MKRWVFLTLAVYLITLVVIILPLALLAFGRWGLGGGISVSEALAFYKEWGYWVWVGVMGLGQALLLIAPVAAEKGRPMRRRSLIVPVVTTAFFLANIFVAA